jgi:hypothetical protein
MILLHFLEEQFRAFQKLVLIFLNLITERFTKCKTFLHRFGELYDLLSMQEFMPKASHELKHWNSSTNMPGTTQISRKKK